MSARLALIRRHPIKSVGGEGLDRVSLAPAQRLPGDRSWAVLTEAGERHAVTSQTDGQPDRWLPKSCFVRGVSSPQLQAIKGGWDGPALHLRHPHQGEIRFDPETDAARFLDWLRPLWPKDAPAPTRLVRGAAIWTDQKWPWISILSLDSLRELETRLGRSLGTDRWRGNLWLEGAPPWAERDWIGRVIRIGQAQLRITDHIGRCDATSADSETGLRDGDMVDTLNRLYGHTDFGIFAEVVSGGDILIGDEITP